MSGADEGAEKELEPTDRKLEQAREKGNFARSADLLTGTSMAGFVLAAMAFGPSSIVDLGTKLSGLLQYSDTLSPMMSLKAQPVMAGIIAQTALFLAPFLLLPAAAVLVVLIASRGIAFTPSNLEPKLSRINPLGNAKRKFGRQGIFEFIKSFVKVALVAFMIAWFAGANLNAIVATIHLDTKPASAAMTRMLLDFLILAVPFFVVLGGLDFLWQYFEHLRQNRMSRQEMTDQYKESEGDPQAKAARRSKGQELALNRMLTDVGTADVVIVNPTHYAVALKWERGKGRAPVCVAKGVDEIAARIRERAISASVPIHRDPPTARALHASLEIGQEISPDHYRAVAAAVRFADAMRKKGSKPL